jgi:hypothetical protein
MIKLYFKQAFHLLKENKLLSSISIIGTALAIAMIMVIVITLRATIAPFAPESYRDRMLIFRYAGFQYKTNENWQSNGPVSYKTAKACFKEMAAPAVSRKRCWLPSQRERRLVAVYCRWMMISGKYLSSISFRDIRLIRLLLMPVQPKQ